MNDDPDKPGATEAEDSDRVLGSGFGSPLCEEIGGFSAGELRLFAELARRAGTIYGSRLLSVQLVGSRARGTARADSDYDFLILLKSCDFDVEVPRMAALSSELAREHRIGPISLSPLSPGQFSALDSKYNGITAAFRRDAVRLAP